MKENELTEQIIGAAIEVHRALGPGLLETVYEACLARELTERGVSFERQKQIPIHYKGELLEIDFRLDLFVGGLVVVELKSVEKVLPIHEAQLLTYLRLTRAQVGLLINFNVEILKEGIRRRVSGLPPSSSASSAPLR